MAPVSMVMAFCPHLPQSEAQAGIIGIWAKTVVYATLRVPILPRRGGFCV